MVHPRNLAMLAAATLVSALLAGCGGGMLQPRNGAPGENPRLVESEFDPLFTAIDRTLRDHRFTIFRNDPRLGEIQTYPLTGQQVWEFWRADAAGFYNQAESSVHTILRTVDARVYPVRDAQDNVVPGKFYLEMRVYTDRVSVPESEVTAANQLPGAYGGRYGLVDQLALESDKSTGRQAVFLGRDSELEDWLIRGVLGELREQPYVAPAPSGTAVSTGR